MKKILMILGFVGVVNAADVQVNYQTFTGLPLAFRLTELAPVQDRRINPIWLVSQEPMQQQTETNGITTFTNILGGWYDLTLESSRPTKYRILVPTNETLYSAAALVTNGVPPGALSNWLSTIAGDARYYPLLSNPSNFVNASITNGLGGGGGGGSGDVTTAQLLDATNKVTTAFQAGDAAVSNLMVSFTITTNLSYTNYLVAALASNNNFNGTYTWTGMRWFHSSATKFITNNGAGFILGSQAAPNTPTAFTNDTLTGQYDTNANQTTPPYVFYPSNAVIETNWFIAGQSYNLPLVKIDAEDFGVRGDAFKIYSATVNAGSLISTVAVFSAEMVGRSAVIYSTSTNTAYVLTKVIGYNNSTNVSIATNYTQATPYEAWVFTDNTVANTNALGSFTGDGIVNYNGKYGSLYGFASSIYDATTARYVVIPIPTDRSTGLLTNTSRTIVLRGQTPPMIYPAFVNAGGTTTLGTPNTGTILYNFAAPVSGSTNTFVYHDGTSAGGSQFARERLVMENITLRQPGKPTHHGVYLARGGTTYLKNFAIDVDQTTNWLGAASGQPPFYMEGVVSNANTIYGIYGPDPYNYAGITLENVTVSYHGTAYRLGEHSVGIGRTIGVACGALLLMDGAFGSQGTYNGSTFDFLYNYMCQYRVVVSTNSSAREPLTVANFSTEEGSPRPDIGSMIYDPLKRGDINIQAITGNAQNTTIESTNGSWNDTILNYSYNRGVIISNATVRADAFTGSGAGLTGITLGALPSSVVTNNFTGNLSGAIYSAFVNGAQGFSETNFWGDGSGLYNLSGNGANFTNLNASALTSGTVPNARLTGVSITNGTLVGPTTNSGVYGSGSTNSGYLLTQTTNLNVTGTGTIPVAVRSSSAALALVGFYVSNTAIKGYFGAYSGGLMFLGDDGATTNMTIAVTSGIITAKTNFNSGGTVTATTGFVSSATNTLDFSTVGFFTNTLGKNAMAYFSAGASVVVTNEYNNPVVSITTPTVIQLHPNWKVSGTTMSATLVAE